MTAWRIGIVGAEQSKWTSVGECRAYDAIDKLLNSAINYDLITVISGECPKGGVDIWAKELAKELFCGYEGYAPKTNDWAGFSSRNLEIVARSDEIHVFTPDKLPGNYPSFCYHCGTWDHVKSGGCWTAKKWLKAKGDQPLPMRAVWHVIRNQP